MDLVTEYDVRVEELVKEEINKAYPGFQLYICTFSMDATVTDAVVASRRSPTLLELDLT